MCIRDRCQGDGGHLGPNPGLFNRYIFDKRLDVGCLLYTSDAADDLLCVDLGGRRIIKKMGFN